MAEKKGVFRARTTSQKEALRAAAAGKAGDLVKDKPAEKPTGGEQS